MINLNSPDIMEAKEAARIWGVSESYVRKTISQSPQKFPEGTVRKFGKQWVVTTEGMEHATAPLLVTNKRAVRKKAEPCSSAFPLT